MYKLNHSKSIFTQQQKKVNNRIARDTHINRIEILHIFCVQKSNILLQGPCRFPSLPNGEPLLNRVQEYFVTPGSHLEVSVQDPNEGTHGRVAVGLEDHKASRTVLSPVKPEMKTVGHM